MAIIVFEHSPLGGCLRLGEVLRDLGQQLRIIQMFEGDQVPPDLDDVDGVISMGGPQSANDADDFLQREMNFIRAADAAQLPIVGICLGSQLTAKALGGEVGRLPGGGAGSPGAGGIELGWHDVTLNDVGREDILHTGLAWTSKQFHWHNEYVTKLPPGARLLGSSKACPVQHWASGVRTYCFQHHPEMFPATIEAWIKDEPGDLDRAGIAVDELRAQTKEFYAGYDRQRNRLFEQIALFLMPVERRFTGLVKDLRH